MTSAHAAAASATRTVTEDKAHGMQEEADRAQALYDRVLALKEHL
jgi:hypothetical protein